jgi:replicative DNA helicase
MVALCVRVNALLAGQALAGLPTGFTRLDAVAGGLCPGQLVTVAARTGVGKTSFALQVAFTAAQAVPVAIFSLEMSQEEILLRAVAQHANVDSSQFFRGYLGRHQHANVIAAVADLAERQWAICDQGTLTVGDVRRHAEAMKASRGLGLVVVDYLQLLAPSAGTSSENRTQQVGAMSRGLKNLARDLDVPVVMLSQLSRATDGRVGKRPQLSDLRESGSIEHDSDKVLFIHRDDDHGDQNTEATIIVAKNRTGPTGAVPVTFIKHATRFEEVR